MLTKEGTLLFVQIDHVSGEVLGYALGKLFDLGAYNVQLIPTITKKNRPGNILIIDIHPKAENQIADFLVKELKVSGYHRIGTSHVCYKVSFVNKTVRVQCNGRHRILECRFKLLGDPSKPLSVDVEHDFLVALQKVVNEISQVYVSLDELRGEIERAFDISQDEIMIQI